MTATTMSPPESTDTDGPAFFTSARYVEAKTYSHEFLDGHPKPDRIFTGDGRLYIQGSKVACAVEELGCRPDELEMSITVTFRRRSA
jgi:hypothetical protein